MGVPDAPSQGSPGGIWRTQGKGSMYKKNDILYCFRLHAGVDGASGGNRGAARRCGSSAVAGGSWLDCVWKDGRRHPDPS